MSTVVNEEKNPSGVAEGSPRPALVGREVDAAVAERVMGWQRQPDFNYWMTFPKGGTFELHALIATWKPSTDIAAAMQVVAKMRSSGWGCVLGFNGMSDKQNGAKFFQGFRAAGHSIFDAEHIPGFDAIGASIEMAICRAALAACEGNESP